MPDDLKSTVELVADLSSVVAVIAAGWWFLYTTQFKPRLQFDVGCHLIRVAAPVPYILAELQFIVENKGFVEHRFYDLNVSVHSLAPTTIPDVKTGSKEVIFPIAVLPRMTLVPKHYRYYFVRPGVRQTITHTIAVPNDVSVLRITASFLYETNPSYPHTARRVFEVAWPPVTTPN